MTEAGGDWDECYFRYVEKGGRNARYESVYLVGDRLKYLNCDRDLKRGTHRAVYQLLKELFDCIQKETGTRPIVCVLSVLSNGHYDVLFDYKNINHLEISGITLGDKHSIFKDREIQAPG